MNICLIGFMGVGKTTIGRILAEKLSWDFIDTDELIVRSTGSSIPELFDIHGESYFRDLEKRAIASLESKKDAVISCGGGAILSEVNLASLRSHSLIVLLWASLPEISKRLADDDSRPLLREAGQPSIERLFSQRKDAYRDAADVFIRTDGLDPIAITERIVQLLKR